MKDSANPNKNELAEALRKAQLFLKNYGFIEVGRIFTTAKEANACFEQVVGGQILNWTGNQFFWKRPPGEDMIFYARNTSNEELKSLGLAEICRIKKMPQVWVGVGRFGIDWPYKKKSDEKPLLFLNLYFFSIDLDDFDALLSNDEANAAYVATLLLDEENTCLLYELAEERFAHWNRPKRDATLEPIGLQNVRATFVHLAGELERRFSS